MTEYLYSATEPAINSKSSIGTIMASGYTIVAWSVAVLSGQHRQEMPILFVSLKENYHGYWKALISMKEERTKP